MDNQPKAKFRDTLLTVTAINGILRDDLNSAMNAVADDASNYALRTFIRTFFAYVEGTAYSYKELALLSHEFNPCFNEAELLILRESAPDVDSKGRVTA